MIATFIEGSCGVKNVPIPEDMAYLKPAAQRQADELAAIMRRMADWYQAYLVWEGSHPPHANGGENKELL